MRTLSNVQEIRDYIAKYIGQKLSITINFSHDGTERWDSIHLTDSLESVETHDVYLRLKLRNQSLIELHELTLDLDIREDSDNREILQWDLLIQNGHTCVYIEFLKG